MTSVLDAAAAEARAHPEATELDVPDRQARDAGRLRRAVSVENPAADMAAALAAHGVRHGHDPNEIASAPNDSRVEPTRRRNQFLQTLGNQTILT